VAPQQTVGRCYSAQMLLQYGADPRLYAEDGMTPGQQSSFDHVRKLLDSWDISLTDKLLQKLQADQEKQRDEDRQMTEAETKRVETQLLAAEKEYDIVEKQVNCLRMPIITFTSTMRPFYGPHLLPISLFVCLSICSLWASNSKAKIHRKSKFL